MSTSLTRVLAPKRNRPGVSRVDALRAISFNLVFMASFGFGGRGFCFRNLRGEINDHAGIAQQFSHELGIRPEIRLVTEIHGVRIQSLDRKSTRLNSSHL